MSKHTPGPWKLTEDNSVMAFDGDSIILIAEASHEANYSYKSNAHLIAAAPELLQALKMAVTRDTGNPDHDWTTCNEPSCIFARAAIAKSEGRHE